MKQRKLKPYHLMILSDHAPDGDVGRLEEVQAWYYLLAQVARMKGLA
jgi:hypothetical protein